MTKIRSIDMISEGFTPQTGFKYTVGLSDGREIVTDDDTLMDIYLEYRRPIGVTVDVLIGMEWKEVDIWGNTRIFTS